MASCGRCRRCEGCGIRSRVSRICTLARAAVWGAVYGFARVSRRNAMLVGDAWNRAMAGILRDAGGDGGGRFVIVDFHPSPLTI